MSAKACLEFARVPGGIGGRSVWFVTINGHTIAVLTRWLGQGDLWTYRPAGYALAVPVAREARALKAPRVLPSCRLNELKATVRSKMTDDIIQRLAPIIEDVVKSEFRWPWHSSPPAGTFSLVVLRKRMPQRRPCRRRDR